MANFDSLTQGASGDLQSDVILQEALDTFLKDLSFFGSIHKDFGGQAMRFNQSLVTRIFTGRSTNDVTDFGAVGGNQNSYNGGSEDTDAEPVSIKLDKHKYIKFNLTDLEREQSEVNMISDIAKHASHALAKSVAEDLLTEGLQHAESATNIAQAAYGIDDLYNLAETMDNKDMPADGRWLVLSSQAYYALLSGLTTITNSSYSVASGIREALLDQRLAGFQVYTYNNLQGLDHDGQGDTGIDAIAGYGGSLAMVNRLPEFADASMQIGDIANASDPSSGLSLQLRRKYDVFDAKEKYALTLMYGLEAPNDFVPADQGPPVVPASGSQRMLKMKVT